MANPNQNPNNYFPFNYHTNENPNEQLGSSSQQNIPQNFIPPQGFGFAAYARPQAGGSSSQPPIYQNTFHSQAGGSSSQPASFQNPFYPQPSPWSSNDSYMGLLLGGHIPYPQPSPWSAMAANQYTGNQIQQTPVTNIPVTPSTPVYPTSSHGTTFGEQDDDSDHEVIPETQEPVADIADLAIDRRRRSKKRLEPHPEEVFPGHPIRWEPDEVLVLAKCYLDISEDEVVGNAQRSDAFWLRVLILFHQRRGRKYRNRDMLIGKWRETSKRVTAYQGIYSGLQRESGVADGDKTMKAMELYKTTMGHEWSLGNVWKYCISHPRWRFIEASSSQSSGSKRTRDAATSDSVESAPQRRRPAGRTKSKNAARGGGSSSTQEPDRAAALERHIQLQAERLEMEKLRIEEAKRARREKIDLKIVEIDPNRYPEGPDRDRFIKKQLEAMERLGMN